LLRNPKTENLIKSGRIFYGRLWLRKGCFASDDDDDDDDGGGGGDVC
jgi:hypothetical protein